MDVLIVIIIIVISSLYKKLSRVSESQSQSLAELLDKNLLPTVHKTQKYRDVELPLKKNYRQKNVEAQNKSATIRHLQDSIQQISKEKDAPMKDLFQDEDWLKTGHLNSQVKASPIENSDIFHPRVKISSKDLQQAVIYKEILDKPLALRE